METDDYNDANRAFLQAFMARSFMTFDEAQPVLAAIISTRGGRISMPWKFLIAKPVDTNRKPQCRPR